MYCKSITLGLAIGALLLCCHVPLLYSQGAYEKHFHSFIFSMESNIVVRDEDSESRLGVRLRNVLLRYDEAEDAYLGEGMLEHTEFELTLSGDCRIVDRLYRSDLFYVRVEVEEYHDAAPDVRLFLRMRGTDQTTLPGEGAVIECTTSTGGTQQFTFAPVPYWAAGWIVIRGDLGEDPVEPHGWPIRDLAVEGWKITGIEDTDFRIHKELQHSATDPDGATVTETARYELLPCLEYTVGFDMAEDAFSFASTGDVIWPESYWSAFRYDLEDPVFRELTGNPAASRFPDWYSFVRAFGEQQTYRSNVPLVYNPAALLRWKQFSRDFVPGACYGFVYSSLLQYCGYRSDLSRPLSALGVEDPVLDDLIAKIFYQFGREALFDEMAQRSTRPKDLVAKLVRNFRDDGTSNRGLAVVIGNYGHVMVPLRIRRCVQDENERRVMTEIDLWDNQQPMEPFTLSINESENIVEGASGGISRGFFPSPPADLFIPVHPNMPKLGGRGAHAALGGDGWSEVYHSGDAAAVLEMPGRTARDLNVPDLDAPEGMIPLIGKTGTVPVVPGYYIADSLASAFAVHLTGGSQETVTVISESTLFDITHNASSAVLRQRFDPPAGSVSLASSSSVEGLSIFIGRVAGEADYTARLDGMQFIAADSLVVAIGPGDPYLTIRNAGGEKMLTLELQRFGDTFARSGKFPGLRIEAGAAAAIVVGSTDSLRTTRVAMRIDRGSDGSVDEEVVLREYGVASADVLPDAAVATFETWPNPANAGAPLRFRYVTTEAVSARLVVYDVLQRRVAEPVSLRRHEARARYEAVWDGRDAAGGIVPPGVYFYALETVQGRRSAGSVTLIR